ncbi:MAG: hypothetical protein GC164_10235 [Phycisphaera sp.]|nr:hypothetical protein [Phycisphaera sp.]
MADAAAHVAQSLDLKPNWLNQDAGMYAHRLPAGWRNRLRRINTFGPMEVMVVGRCDLLALKLMGIAKRPHDLEDIETMRPTSPEIDFLDDYLDQQEAESLDRETFERQRSILKELRSTL